MNRLKELRKKHKWTQQKVSLDLHLSRESISHYETGRDDIPTRTLLLFSKYYQTTTDYILCADLYDMNMNLIIGTESTGTKSTK